MSTSPDTPCTDSRTDAALRSAEGVQADCASPEAVARNAQSQVLGAHGGPERVKFALIEPQVQLHLASIAAALEAQRTDLSREWRQRVSGDMMLASSPAWSKRQFDDHIPESLLVLCAKIRSWPDIASQHLREQEAARAHSKHRWQQGYDLRSLTREWGHLNTCLMSWLDHFWRADSGGSAQQALRVARSVVAEMILESSSESVSQYAQLSQNEASVRARHLEMAIEAMREEERARGQVLREAAHDLRGSLGIVSGSASIVDRSHMDQDDRAELGRILRRGVHSLHTMMTDLIDLARLEAGEEIVSNRLFDVSQVLRELGTTVQPLAQNKGLELILHGPEEMRAWGDSVKVRRVAQNLLLNAIKYTHQGAISLFWALDGEDRWLLRIEDTGPGIEIARTTPMVRALHEATNTSRQVEGRTEGEQNPVEATATSAIDAIEPQPRSEADVSRSEPLSAGLAGEGVGLSIVKRLCDLMGASIELDTRPGSGSAFRVLFVRTPSASAPTQQMGDGQIAR